MMHDDDPTGLSPVSNKTFSQRLAERITVGHLLAAGVLAGFGGGFGTHALVGEWSDGDTSACAHADLEASPTSDAVDDTRVAFGVEFSDEIHRRHGCRMHHKHRRRHRHARGVSISKVIAGSPAEASGLRKGDVIVTIDGKVVRSFTALQRTLRSRSVGDHLDLHVHRGEEMLDLEIELEAYIDVFHRR